LGWLPVFGSNGVPVFLEKMDVLQNTKVAADTWLMRLESPHLAQNARPGQFVMVAPSTSSVPGAGPLLKRPFSLHRIKPDNEIHLLYRVVGLGTRMLSDVRVGQGLEVLGPLGRGFRWPADLRKAYLVAGGIGLAPLLALADALPPEAEVTLFYGARTAAELLSAELLGKLGQNTIVTTDDGSAGQAGLITVPLAEALEKSPAPVFACGPHPMLAEIARLALQYGVSAQVSMEASMACGLGACLGCVIEAKGSEETNYVRVCREGPVFDAGEVQW
jgi:dihydroorotate dehydrogenase electron transfer subunit